MITPYNPAWPAAFERERQRLQALLDILSVDHIGSTSVPGLAAKPIIDILVSVKSLASLDKQAEALRASGYDYLGEHGLAGRRYLRRQASDGTHTHHIHVYKQGDESLHRHLVFRDYLRAHAEEREDYGALKRKLVETGVDRKGYQSGKDDFVAALELRALAWAAQ
ncbi:MAG: GrpB family protein [Maricaulis sp.]|uniref:GrpB family protein n=1 Tax=Maricaulis sp. TaxID=1486257 RepID=UPI00263128AC|nr:GrpB family protein [Maricaulis sp.]MDM7985520.1 GrpB family protein [Maricaulis sp.]